MRDIEVQDATTRTKDQVNFTAIVLTTPVAGSGKESSSAMARVILVAAVQKATVTF